MKINKKIDHRKLWLDSMTGMSLGFFSTLIIANLFGIIGLYSASNIFLDVKRVFTVATSFAIGIGIGVRSKSSPLQILSIALATTLVANSMMVTKLIGGQMVFDQVKLRIDTAFVSPGDVLSAWVSGALMLYVFQIIKWESHWDFLVVPILGVLLGMFGALWLTYLVSIVVVFIEFVIAKTVDQNFIAAIFLAPVIGILMGLALTLPTSSAAMAVAIGLKGDAALAALAGTAAQMMSFGLLTYWSTRNWSKTLSVAFGTSKLHMPNYSRRPIILVIPVVASGVTALVAIAAFFGKIAFQPGVTSGMGTAVIYGPIFTIKDAGVSSIYGWLNVVFIQLLLPLVVTTPLLYWFDKKQWLRKEWLELWNNTQPSTLAEPAK